jgi:Gas vesicle synthesis protein GvpO
MAEKRSTGGKKTSRAGSKPRKASASKPRKASASKPRRGPASSQRQATRSAEKKTARGASSSGQGSPGQASTSGRPPGRRNGLSAAEAVSRAREALSELLGRRVESVLGIDRDHGNWVATVQVVELSRIPNTTDVLGDYETVLDSRGDVLRYHRTRRYHRGQIDGGR